MQIGHIRIMSFGPHGCRADTLWKHESTKGFQDGAQQFHASIEPTNDEELMKFRVGAAIRSIGEAVKKKGGSLSECYAPKMILTCEEPPEVIQKAFRAVMA